MTLWYPNFYNQALSFDGFKVNFLFNFNIYYIDKFIIIGDVYKFIIQRFIL